MSWDLCSERRCTWAKRLCIGLGFVSLVKITECTFSPIAKLRIHVDRKFLITIHGGCLWPLLVRWCRRGCRRNARASRGTVKASFDQKSDIQNFRFETVFRFETQRATRPPEKMTAWRESICDATLTIKHCFKHPLTRIEFAEVWVFSILRNSI